MHHHYPRHRSPRAWIDEGPRVVDEPWQNGEVPKEVVLLRKVTQCECGRTGLYLHLHIVC